MFLRDTWKIRFYLTFYKLSSFHVFNENASIFLRKYSNLNILSHWDSYEMKKETFWKAGIKYGF